jgi:hypothetical protein
MKDGQLSGKGAPNLYMAPYTAGPGNSLTIQSLDATKLPIFNPEFIKEKEYFEYLSRIKTYTLGDGRMEFTTADENGRTLVLVFEK